MLESAGPCCRSPLASSLHVSVSSRHCRVWVVTMQTPQGQTTWSLRRGGDGSQCSGRLSLAARCRCQTRHASKDRHLAASNAWEYRGVRGCRDIDGTGVFGCSWPRKRIGIGTRDQAWGRPAAVDPGQMARSPDHRWRRDAGLGYRSSAGGGRGRELDAGEGKSMFAVADVISGTIGMLKRGSRLGHS